MSRHSLKNAVKNIFREFDKKSFTDFFEFDRKKND